MGYPPVPAPPGNICRYAVYLSDYRQLSASSIPKYLNVVRLMHLECNLPNPLCDNWHLSSVLRGIKRCKGEPAHKKLPITPAILLQIHALLNFDSPLHIVFWDACLTLFFGLFRKSNVLAPTGAFNPEKYLCRRDILVHPWGLEILARWTKTMQNRERVLSVPLPHIPGHTLCPTAAVLRAFQCSPCAARDGPAFTFTTPMGVRPLCYRPFIQLLRQLLHRLGYLESQFAGHSFRRGGASFPLQAGVSGDLLMLLGDWKFCAYTEYLEVPVSYKARCMFHVIKALPAAVNR